MGRSELDVNAAVTYSVERSELDAAVTFARIISLCRAGLNHWLANH